LQPWRSGTAWRSMAQHFKSDLRTILREVLLLHTETTETKGICFCEKGMERILQIPLSPKSATEVSDSVHLDAI
jgi:hypothetical protein